MPFHLIFLFLFQSGLAFAFTFFLVRIVIGNYKTESREKAQSIIRQIRNVVLGLSVILPPVTFIAYFKSLPEGKSASLAVWPTAWILMLMGAIVLALSLANYGSSTRSGNP